MAQISEITIKDLLKHQRIDAEYFRPFFVNAYRTLETGKTIRLDEISVITDGEHGSPDLDESSGIYYLSGNNVKNNFLDLSDVRFCTETAYQKNKRARLLNGNVLLSIVGTVGNSAVIEETLEGTTDRNVATIKNLDDNFSPYYLATFLNSKFGKAQTVNASTGNVQPLLNLTQVKKIQIPILSKSLQSKVESIVKNGLQQLNKSKSLYAQAEQLLLQELRLEDFTPEWVAGYETDFDNILEVARMDAEYFQPRYESLMNRIFNAKKTEKLGEISVLSKKKVDIQTEETYKYIEIGDVNTSNGEFSYNEIAGSDLPTNAKKSIQEESLLISTVRPTRGAVGVIPNGWNDGFVVSGAFAVFEKHSISPFYLQVVMRSVVGKMQLERRCTGVSYPTVTDEDVANVIVPLLNDERIKKIHDLVIESHKSLHESRQLLEQAKREVEEMIESKTK